MELMELMEPCRRSAEILRLVEGFSTIYIVQPMGPKRKRAAKDVQGGRRPSNGGTAAGRGSGEPRLRAGPNDSGGSSSCTNLPDQCPYSLPGQTVNIPGMI